MRVYNNSRRQVWHYNRADFELAADLSDHYLDTLIDPSDVNFSWNKWKLAFLEIMAICIPRTQEAQSAMADKIPRTVD